MLLYEYLDMWKADVGLIFAPPDELFVTAHTQRLFICNSLIVPMLQIKSYFTRF